MIVALLLASAVPARDQVEIKKYVGDKLLDGESARWRWPARTKPFGSYCGWVNAKNSYGAYTGFRPYFFVGGRSSTGSFIAGDATIADGNENSDSTVIVMRMCAKEGYDLSEVPPG